MKRKIISLCAFLLLAVTVITGVNIPVSALGEKPETINCSNPDAPIAPKEIKASEFISLLGGGTVDRAEAEYIDSVLEEAFIYSDGIPTGRIKVNYDGETIYISAKSYEYTSASGIDVKWIPDSVILEGNKYDLMRSDESDSFECRIDFVGDGIDECYVNIEYSFEITVSRADAEAFMNYAYSRAVDIDREISEYEIQLAAYNSYTKYLEELKAYNTQNELYEQYVKDKAIYDAALARYEKYVSDLEDYNIRYWEYILYKESVDSFDERLLEYNNYLDAKKAYDDAVPIYLEYVAVIEKARKKLSVMDNMFIANSKSQVMFATLMGPTVQQVLDNQDLLISYGKVDPSLITQTGEATEALKELLLGYKAETDFYGRYEYYVKNYEKIKENFIILYRNLHQLYQNGAVYTGIVQKERLNRYVEFVCHLYVLQGCLDDSFDYDLDNSWRIHREYDEEKRKYNYYSYTDILEACQMPSDDNNFSPYDLMTLPERMEAPIQPDEVAQPIVLPKVDEPIKPDEVSEPKEIDVVNEPIKPIEVAYAEKPVEKQYTTAELTLRNAYLEGKVIERTVSSDVELRLVTSARKLVPLDERFIVTFYDDDGETVLYSYTATYGDSIEYVGATPYKNSTDKYTYTFDGWRTDDGKVDELGTVEEQETVFYASYKSELNEYMVVWNVDGNVITETYEYGQMPVFTGSTDKFPDARYVYTFSGWSTAPDKVTGNAIYIAQYTVSDRMYNVTFDVGGKVYSEQYKYGETPMFNYSTYRAADESYSYIFSGWDKEFAEVTADESYAAQYEKKSLVEDKGGNSLTVTAPDPTGDNMYSTEVSGTEIKADVLSEVAKNNGAGISTSWFSDECKIILPEKVAGEFSDKSGTYISLEKSEDGSYSLQLLASNRESVTLEAPLTVMIRSEDADENTRVYLRDENGVETRLPSSYAEGSITVKLSNGGEILLKNEYSLTANDFVGGVVTFDKREAFVGDKVKVSLSINNDYTVKEIIIVGDKSGNKYSLDGEGNLTMPSESVTVTVITEEKTYTVTFISDGKIISSKQYKKGELIECPADPTKDATEKFIYQFLEWDPLFADGAVVSGDVTYNAVFRELLIEDQKGFVPEDDNKFEIFVITVLCLFVVFVACVTTVIIILMKRRKKKRAGKSGKA